MSAGISECEGGSVGPREECEGVWGQREECEGGECGDKGRSVREGVRGQREE